MEDLDFTQPSKSPVYDPAAARAFFEGSGTAKEIAAGKTFFVEREGGGFFSADDRMYLLVEGLVAITINGKPIDVVKPGEVFGELATITDSKRSATATAKIACRVLALDGQRFQAAIAKNPGFALILMSIMIERLRLRLARLNMLKAQPSNTDERHVFDKSTLDEISRKLGNPQLMRYSAGQAIIKAGETGVLMYLVHEGRIAITAKSSLLEHVGVGGVFGEMALVDHAARAANAVAETDCALMAINRKQLLKLVQTNPEFGLSLLKVLGQRLQATTGQPK